jgi:hypothetical protein
LIFSKKTAKMTPLHHLISYFQGGNMPTVVLVQQGGKNGFLQYLADALNNNWYKVVILTRTIDSIKNYLRENQKVHAIIAMGILSGAGVQKLVSEIRQVSSVPIAIVGEATSAERYYLKQFRVRFLRPDKTTVLNYCDHPSP